MIGFLIQRNEKILLANHVLSSTKIHIPSGGYKWFLLMAKIKIFYLLFFFNIRNIPLKIFYLLFFLNIRNIPLFISLWYLIYLFFSILWRWYYMFHIFITSKAFNEIIILTTLQFIPLLSRNKVTIFWFVGVL